MSQYCGRASPFPDDTPASCYLSTRYTTSRHQASPKEQSATPPSSLPAATFATVPARLYPRIMSARSRQSSHDYTQPPKPDQCSLNFNSRSAKQPLCESLCSPQSHPRRQHADAKSPMRLDRPAALRRNSEPRPTSARPLVRPGC